MKKRILSLCLALALALTLLPAPALAQDTSDTAVFRDIAGHWAEATITEWQQSGRTSGYSDGTFRPGSHITRAEFVTLLNRTLGLTAEREISFSDVAEKDWFYSEAAKAAAAGYVVGTRDGKFHPEASITRAEAAVMLARALALPENTARAEAFPDASAIPAWAEGSVGAAAEAGFMTGYPSGAFGALDPITRAEAVVTLDRVLRRAQDMTITDDGTLLADETVAGDLIIAESVGEGTVTLKRVTVEGDLIIRGGGANSVYLNDVTVKGEVRLEKENLHPHLLGGTKLGTVRALAKVRISGSGTIELLIAEASGVRLDRNLTVRKTEVADGVKAPTVYNPASSSDGGSTTIRVVTSVSAIAPITVDYNTSEQDALAQLPGTMTLNCEGGSTVQAGVTWTMDEYNGVPQTTTTYIATGTVTLPSGYTYNGGTQMTATATITVRGANQTVKKIVWPAEGIEVSYNTDEATAMSRLPKELALKTYGDTAFAPVTWERKEGQTYTSTPTTAATVTYVGTVALPDGYEQDAQSSAEDLQTTGETTITVVASDQTAATKKLMGSYISDGIVEHYTTEQSVMKASISTTVRLECADGSLITVTITDPAKWSDSNTIDSSNKPGYIAYKNFQYNFSDLEIPDGYSFNVAEVVIAAVHVKDRDDTGLQAALDAANALLDRIVLTEDAALADLEKIWRAPDGTTADKVATGVQFVAESEIKTLENALRELVHIYPSADTVQVKNQAEINELATDITKATEALQNTLKTNLKKGSGFSQANVLVSIRERLESIGSNYAYGKDKQPLTVEKYNTVGNGVTGIGLPWEVTGVKIDADGNTAAVKLVWSMGDTAYAELLTEQYEKRQYVQLTGKNVEPRDLSLIVHAISYQAPDGSTVYFKEADHDAGVQVEAYNNLIVGAPVSVAADKLDLAAIPKLTSGQKDAPFAVQIPLRKSLHKIQKITVKSSDIDVICTDDLLTGIQFTDVPTQDEDDGHKAESHLYFKMTATTKQLAAVVDSDKAERATVTFTIPHDAIELTDEAKADGWYIPKNGLELTAYVDILHPLVKITGTKLEGITDQQVRVKFDANHWGDLHSSVRMALVPATVTEFTGTAEGSVTSKYGIGVSGDKKYDSLNCDTTIPAAGLKKDTEYIVWVKVDNGSWQKSNYSYTHQS